MAIQIFRRDKPALGEILGTGLGAGLSSGLQALAERKLADIDRRRKQEEQYRAAKYAGATDDEARAFSMFDPRLQQAYVKNLGAKEGEEGLNRLLTEIATGAQKEPTIEDLLATTATTGEATPDVTAPPQIAPKKEGLGTAFGGSTFGAHDKLKLAGYQQRERHQRESKEFKEKALSSKEKIAAFNETKEFRKDVRAKAKSDRDNFKRVQQMRKLHNEGKLDNPLYISFLEKVGLDMPALMSPASQEFKTVALGFLRQAREMFGARVTNFEAAVFLKSLPSLLQTEEGRARALKIFEDLYSEGTTIEKTMDDIINKNDGIPPFNLDSLVAQEMEKRRDDAANNLKNIINPYYQQELQSGALDKTLTEMGVPSETASSLVGKTIDINMEVQDETTGKLEDGTEVVRRGGKWVPVSSIGA